MVRKSIFTMLGLFITCSALWTLNFNGNMTDDDKKTILRLEKEALDRWINRDVWGFIDLFCEEATYFDQTTKSKLVGRKEIENYLAPWHGKIYAPAYEMVNTNIEILGDIGLLTYNLKSLNEKGEVTVFWNTSEVYRKTAGKWQLLHSHFSIVNSD